MESWFPCPAALSVEDNMWGKLDMGPDRPLYPASCPSFGMPHTHPWGNRGNSLLPTPPHSPGNNVQDLDELVAFMPEILERSAAPPSNFTEILWDLEGLEGMSLQAGSVVPPGSWSPVEYDAHLSWWTSLPTPSPEQSVKEEPVRMDIMWGGGSTPLLQPKEEDITIKEEVMYADEVAPAMDTSPMSFVPQTRHQHPSSSSTCSSISSIVSDALPDTPPATDNDADEADDGTVSTVRARRMLSREHDYCSDGVPGDVFGYGPSGVVTPSDTEDDSDMSSSSDIGSSSSGGSPDPFSPGSGDPTVTSASAGPTSPLSNPSSPSKYSEYVKRELQLAIKKSIRNRLTAASELTSSGLPTGVSGSLVPPVSPCFTTPRIRTHGKPASYTKRMRAYHSEVMKTNKRRKVNGNDNLSEGGRRSVHNSLERKRRVDLANAFEYLRTLVPETQVQERSPKVQILKKAACYCRQLSSAEDRLVREKERLRKQLEALRRRCQV